MGIISTGGEGGESVGADLSYLQFQGTIASPLAWPYFLTHGWKINDIGFACILLFKGTQYELVFYTMIGLDDSIENKVCPLKGPLIGGYIPWRSKQEDVI